MNIVQNSCISLAVFKRNILRKIFDQAHELYELHPVATMGGHKFQFKEEFSDKLVFDAVLKVLSASEGLNEENMTMTN